MQANGTTASLSPAVRHTIQNHGSDYYLAASPTNSTLIAGSIPDNYARWQLSSSTNNDIYTIRLQPTGTCLYATSTNNLALHECSTADNVWNVTQTAQRDGYTIVTTGDMGLRIDGMKVALATVSSSPDFVWSLSDIGNVGSLPPIVVPSSSVGGTGSMTTVTSGVTTSTQTVSVTAGGSSSTMPTGGLQSGSSTSAATSPTVSSAAGTGGAGQVRVNGLNMVAGLMALAVLMAWS